MDQIIAQLNAVIERLAAVDDENVQDTLRLARSKIGKVKPEFPRIAEAELNIVVRWLGDAAYDAAYANGGEYDDAKAAKQAIFDEIGDIRL
jgi:hypothetical protein